MSDTREVNVENVHAAINVMRRAGKVDMRKWQSGEDIVHSESELHTCGTGACFAGWLAVSPEFKAAGGYTGNFGEPVLGSSRNTGAIAKFLGICQLTAYDLCAISYAGDYTDGIDLFYGTVGIDPFYGVEASAITAEHVIEKLQELL